MKKPLASVNILLCEKQIKESTPELLSFHTLKVTYLVGIEIFILL